MHMERVNRSAPCIFCGRTDRDMRMIYGAGEDETVHWCRKTNASKGDIVSVGGYDYICIATGKETEVGVFDLWKRYLTKEEWKEKHRGELSFKEHTYRDPNALLPGEVKPLSHKELHERYSYFLSLLVLEEKHRVLMEKEWSSVTNPALGKELLKKYPIKSLPPIDKARFANNEGLENPSRKKIIAMMIVKFGDLRGIPGFYMRTGSYYENKPEEERWTFTGSEGIVFPCYDKDGYLYRIRYRDDYPDLKLQEGKHEPFHGKYGVFHHYYNKEGKHSWSFTPDGGESVIVYEGGASKQLVSLKKNGCPSISGKTSGKYKNFSSLSYKREGTETVNGMHCGARSGSPYSLYYTEGQPFTAVIGTEGEKKSIVSSAIKNVPVVCVPGVNSYSCLFEKDDSGESCMDFLKKKGMKYFFLCYDADKEENESVKKAEASFIETLKNHGIKVMVGEWSGKFDKGIDDILLMGLDISLRPV